jgi:predicted RNA-binding protein with PUA-like domain
VKYWLMKSEPEAYSIDDLERDGKTSWDGVRNFQARNFLREMKAGDKVLFYASSADPSGVTGIAEVSGEARPEPKDATRSMVDLWQWLTRTR